MSEVKHALLWAAWREMNAIRARSGVPLDERGFKQGISESYWSALVDAMAEELGDDAKPWPPENSKSYWQDFNNE